jgi:hypothetical protein
MFGHKPNKADPSFLRLLSKVKTTVWFCSPCYIVVALYFLFLTWNFAQHVMCWNTKRRRISFINIHTVETPMPEFGKPTGLLRAGISLTVGAYQREKPHPVYAFG